MQVCHTSGKKTHFVCTVIGPEVYRPAPVGKYGYVLLILYMQIRATLENWLADIPMIKPLYLRFWFLAHSGFVRRATRY
jgi:hypothetical protein